MIRRLAVLAAFCTIVAVANSASAVLIADLRGDYDTPIVPYANGQTSAGNVPDTIGSGNWTFRDSLTPNAGASPNLLVYTTSANGQRGGNLFIDGTSDFGVPGISNTGVFPGDGSAGAGQLAVHPGSNNSARPYLVVRWTAGVNTTAQVTGSIFDQAGFQNGITFAAYLNGTTNILASQTTVGNTPINFNFNQAVAPGSFIDFVIGNNNGDFIADQSFLSIQINGALASEAAPEPASGAIALVGLVAIGWAANRRKRAAR